jgi:hypothetical protein
MGWSHPADIGPSRFVSPISERPLFQSSMCTPSTWKCPGCGTIVILPADCRATGEVPDRRRLDQLAQALCGCWVVRLPDSGLARLMRAIMTGDDGCYEDPKPGLSGGR